MFATKKSITILAAFATLRVATAAPISLNVTTIDVKSTKIEPSAASLLPYGATSQRVSLPTMGPIAVAEIADTLSNYETIAIFARDSETATAGPATSPIPNSPDATPDAPDGGAPVPDYNESGPAGEQSEESSGSDNVITVVTPTGTMYIAARAPQFTDGPADSTTLLFLPPTPSIVAFGTLVMTTAGISTTSLPPVTTGNVEADPSASPVAWASKVHGIPRQSVNDPSKASPSVF